MKKFLIIFLMSIVLCGCNNNVETKKQYLNQTELNTIISENNYIIIDVRTKEEYDELHIKNAINIPYDKINENSEIDKNKIIFVYCKSGKRSKIAYETLVNLGYIVYDLQGIDDIALDKE